MRTAQPASHTPQHCRKGFSLVELSVVLVIIGLVVGMIMVGQSMLYQSRISSTMKMVETIRSAYTNFSTQYGGQLPGDFTEASRFWPSCTTENGKIYANPCNGNGDRIIRHTHSEGIRAWQHLTLAGLMPGNYTGRWGDANWLKLGENIPEASLAQIGIYVNHHENGPNPQAVFGRFGNTLQFGNAANWPGAIFTPTEAYNTDKKFDDGLASTGDFRAATLGGGMPLCTTAFETAGSADYVFNENATTCRLWVFGFD